MLRNPTHVRPVRALIRAALIAAVTFIVVVAFVSGCDSTELDPFQNSGRYYSVYGYISDLQNQHAIRVVEVSRYQEHILSPSDAKATIDAVVTTTDTLTGEVVHWNHTLAQFEDGSYGHVFRATFNVRAGRTYRLDITRSDGRTTSAITTVPFLSSTRAEVRAPIVGADSSIFQDILLPGVRSPWSITVVYHVRSSPAVRLEYGRAGERVEGEGWLFRVDYTQDIAQLLELLGTTLDELEWDAMGVEVLVLDNDWTLTDDLLDPETLSHPDQLSNVENGYGYFGSIGLLQNDWPNSARLDSLFGFPH